MSILFWMYILLTNKCTEREDKSIGKVSFQRHFRDVTQHFKINHLSVAKVLRVNILILSPEDI